VPSATAVPTIDATAEPKSTAMKGGRTAVTLMACMAATPDAGVSLANPGITNEEKAKKTPPAVAQPNAAAPVKASMGRVVIAADQDAEVIERCCAESWIDRSVVG